MRVQFGLAFSALSLLIYPGTPAFALARGSGSVKVDKRGKRSRRARYPRSSRRTRRYRPRRGHRRHRVTMLRNQDFKDGTLQITKSGVYRLAEDISFNPHPVGSHDDKGRVLDAYRAGRPFYSQFGSTKQGKYDPKAYGVGFFAAISIQAENVVLDLNGFRIEQSAEHALHQRFFAVIELANQPFIPRQGPADFGDHFIPAKRVTIKNGTIGRSAHHGIHGNGNEGVQLENLRFRDYEVAAMALNGVKRLRVRNCDAKSREDVPVLGTFSNARFISTYLDYLVRKKSTTSITVLGNQWSAAEIQQELRRSINEVYEDVITDGLGQIDEEEHPESFALFHNEHAVVDGNSYGFLLNPMGAAVMGFPRQSEQSAQDVLFENVQVRRQRANVSEVVALARGGKVVTDPVGAVFMIHNANPRSGEPLTISSFEDPEAIYVGNVLANAQALVAKAALAKEFPFYFDVSRMSIDQGVLDWIEQEQPLSSIIAEPSDYLCNGDTMFHVNKGVIGLKIDGAQGVRMRGVSVRDLENFGAVGSGLCGDYEFSHPGATLPGYGGAKVRGISIAGSSDVRLHGVRVSDLSSQWGSVYGVDLLTDSENVEIHRLSLRDLRAGVAQEHCPGLEGAARAVGLRVGSEIRGLRARAVRSRQLQAPGKTLPIERLD